MADQDAQQLYAGIAGATEYPDPYFFHVNADDEIVTIAIEFNPAGTLHKPSLLSDLVDIRRQLSSDRDRDREVLRQRDRDIGRSLTRNGSETVMLRRWIAAIRNGDADPARQGRTTQQGMSTLIAALWLLGLVAGWLLGNAVLRYDGSEPVNIISALVVLVASQLLTLLALLVLMVFGLERMREALSIINPALWLTRFGARLGDTWRTLFRDLLDDHGGLADHGVRRWVLVYLAQHFTVALNLGIIAALLYLVTVSDLAFGWNTTLAVDTGSIGSLFHWISSPWRWIFPAASPDPGLVEASRYYRLQSSLRPGALPVASLGTWWLFLLMCLVVYGLLPRLLALLISGMRYDGAIGAAIRGSAGAAQVLARMQSPLVSSAAERSEQLAPSTDAPIPLRRRQSARAIDAVVIEWSGAEANRESLKRAGFSVERRYAAGGTQSVAADRALAEQVAAHGAEAVVLVVRSWEPPMLDFVDFLELVRERMSPRAVRIVLLLPIAGQGAVRAEHLESWESALYATDDTALYVETLG